MHFNYFLLKNQNTLLILFGEKVTIWDLIWKFNDNNNLIKIYKNINKSIITYSYITNKNMQFEELRQKIINKLKIN